MTLSNNIVSKVTTLSNNIVSKVTTDPIIVEYLGIAKDSLINQIDRYSRNIIQWESEITQRQELINQANENKRKAEYALKKLEEQLPLETTNRE